MGILGRFLKSKEEKEWERKTRLREARSRISRYVEKSTRLLKSYEQNAIEARRIENAALLRRFATKIYLLNNQIKRMKSLQLLLSDIELSREQIGLFNSVAVTMRDFSKVMAHEEISAKMASELDRNLTGVLSRSERIDTMLGDVLDSINDKILDIGEVDEEGIETVLASIEEKATTAEREAFRLHTGGTEYERNASTSSPRVEIADDRTNSKVDSSQKDSLNDLDRRIERGLKKIKDKHGR